MASDLCRSFAEHPHLVLAALEHFLSQREREGKLANLILIGLRGSGKSTIGRVVAARLGRGFVDLDERTPREMGCATVAEAWARGGEPAFRAAEVAALKKVLAGGGQVISLGGGSPTAPGAADLLREHRDQTGAVIVYLHAPATVLRDRLAASDNAHRPALTPGASDPLAEVELVYARRDPAYRTLADVVVETSQKDAAAVVGEVVRLAGG